MSRELAERVARDRGAYLPVVMATIEAETNFRNVLGQYAAWSARFGIGFGQVHLRWHFATLQQVARELNITLPSQNNPMHNDAANEPFRRLILGNDLLSMHLAVAVIDRKWRGSGGNWDRFTEAYVGAGISDRDRERRRIIWNRWREHFRTAPAAPAPAPTPAPGRRVSAAVPTGMMNAVVIGLIVVVGLIVFGKAWRGVRGALT